jgi:tRNA(Arg) A34 adenosine deaminase TadA
MTDTGPAAGSSEERYLAQAVQLALDNLDSGQLPFGALVIRDGAVLATGVNTALRDQDPTAHAEVAAIRNACRELGVLHLAGATIASSCEPCAICHAVSAAVGIDRIVYAAPKESVPELGDTSAFDDHGLLTRMQRALRDTAPDQLQHISIRNADQPFAEFTRRRS